MSAFTATDVAELGEMIRPMAEEVGVKNFRSALDGCTYT